MALAPPQEPVEPHGLCAEHVHVLAPRECRWRTRRAERAEQQLVGPRAVLPQPTDQPERVHSPSPLEELHGLLVLLGGGPGLERSEVASLPGLRVELAGVEPVLAALEFADHGRGEQLLVAYQTTERGS